MLRFEDENMIMKDAYEIIGGDIFISEGFNGDIEDILWDIYRDYPNYENCGMSGRYPDRAWYVLTMEDCEGDIIEVNLYW